MTTPDQAASNPELARELRRALGPDAVLSDPAAVERYGRDETEALFFRPELVVLPASLDQVSAVLCLASAHGVPVTPRGAGTGLSGGALPVHGGIVLGLERMNRIRGIDERNLTVEAETGVVLAHLQDAVEAKGLFYPPDPASRETCLIGGNLAEDSAGPRSCKHGSTRRWVLGLEAVLPDGSVMRTGGANRKDVTGYNLTQILVGSEGTLAVLTAATLRLIAKPRATLTMLVPFDSLDAAAAAVESVFREGHDPVACELLEEAALQAVEAVLPIPPQLIGKQALLLLELDGDDSEALLERAAGLAATTERLGGGDAIVAQDVAEQRRLWAIRRKVGEAVKHRSLYKECDTVVPRSALADLVRAARSAAARHGLEVICYGHAGDGNLHVNLLRGNLPNAQWEASRDAAEAELFQAAVALGGKITGEHGIGLVQRRYLPLAADPASLEIMRRLKAAFDPQGILNPGKIFL
ncbi:MAG: FAD-linked oxidase C-terminal domain-containing protein [Acidobacteriota bacterium]